MIEERVKKQLAGFTQHGVQFDQADDEQARGRCPFCDRERKFFVNPKSKGWDCKVCGKQGGFHSFLVQRMEVYQGFFRGPVAVKLAKDRGVSVKSLRAFGTGYNPAMGWYAIPLYDPKGNVVDIQRYRIGKQALSTTGRDFGCIQVNGENKTNRIWLTEGLWDACVLRDVFSKVGIEDSIKGLAGANGFHQKLGFVFDDKEVMLPFDNDPAGEQGATRFTKLFGSVCKRIKYIQWPVKFREGYDLRDLYLDSKKSARTCWDALQKLLSSEQPKVTEDDDTEQGQVNAEQPDGEGLAPEVVVKAYRDWLHLPDVEPLYVLFGSIFANRFDGDPLWLFLVAPPGGAKSELIMPLADAPLIYTTTSLTPHALVSGASFGQGDPSLIPRLNGKVLAVKDFTTILSMNQLARDEVFGVLRDAYDGRTEKHFGNGVVRRYVSKFGIIAGVTPAIEAFANSSVLGERFLKYQIPSGQVMGVTFKNSNFETVMRALRNVTREGKMRENLCQAASDCLNRKVTMADQPKITERMLERIAGLAHFVARLRAVVSREKYTGHVTFKPTPEVPTRLSKQLLKLGMGISVFKREKELSQETYQTLVKVACDTAPDRVEMVVRTLYLQRSGGWMSTRAVSDLVRFPQNTVLYLLQDLDLLGIVQRKPGGMAGEWRLSAILVDLMEDLQLYLRESRWVQAHQKKSVKVGAPRKVAKKKRKVKVRRKVR